LPDHNGLRSIPAQQALLSRTWGHYEVRFGLNPPPSSVPKHLDEWQRTFAGAHKVRQPFGSYHRKRREILLNEGIALYNERE
jgi:hypothetical protein